MSGEARVSDDAEEETPFKPSHRWRWWLIGGGALVVVALMLGSAAGGWWLANRAIAASTSNVTEETEDEGELVLSDELTMPDVRGLDPDEASQVLADSGFPASIVIFENTPSAAPAGIVVTQSPQFGATSPLASTLGVAVPTTMPDVAGMQRDEAVNALSDLGVAVTVQVQYSPGESVGRIVGSSPAAGAPLGETATLTLAGAGASATLDQLTRNSGSCRSDGRVSLAGENFATSLQCPIDGDPQTTVWMLRSQADRFTATLGIDDTAAPGSTATVEVLADGAVVASEHVAFGKPVEVDVPVTGVLQLAVRVSAPNELDVVLGGATIHGTDEAIAELTK